MIGSVGVDTSGHGPAEGGAEAGRAPAARAPRLDRARITAAAVELLDEDGLGALSTRRLAAKLGVRSPTLYWHVRSKAELLDLVAEAICADAFRIDTALPWRDQLSAGLHQFRALLLRHRDAAALLQQRPPTGPNRLAHIDTTAGILLRAGFTAADAAAIARVLTAHVLASAGGARHGDGGQAAPPPALADPPADLPHLRAVGPALARLDADAVYATGVELLLDGLELRLARTPRSAG
ncbi:TetR/AcrR family transcriptional regulator [Nocardiopsis coralliicola]